MLKETHLGTILPHPGLGSGADINWESIRVFMKVAETHSFRTAAREMRCSARALRARVEDLEHMVGAMVFTRDATGVYLTPTGEIIYERGLAMLQSAQSLRGLCERGQIVRRTVSIGCSEGIGTFWLLPRLIDFYERYRGARVRLNIDPKPHNVRALEVDIAVQLDEPKADPEVKIVRLCSVHVVLFASGGYILRHGAPASRSELIHHNVLEIAAPQIASDALALDELGDPRDFIDLSLNTGSAQLVAANRGAGITAMPAFTTALTHGLEHVARDWQLRRDVWLVFNSKAAELPHVRKAIDWIKEAFDPGRYPWFRDEMMSPAEILAYVRHHKMEAMFGGYEHYAGAHSQPEADCAAAS